MASSPETPVNNYHLTSQVANLHKLLHVPSFTLLNARHGKLQKVFYIKQQVKMPIPVVGWSKV
jgi:hypothetical protein